jgi:hypothetical protein
VIAEGLDGPGVIEGDRVIVEFWTRMLGGREPLTLVGTC